MGTRRMRWRKTSGGLALLLSVMALGASCYRAEDLPGGGGEQGPSAGGTMGAGGTNDRGSDEQVNFPHIWLPGETRWLGDDEIWTLLPDLPVWDDNCFYREADPDRIPIPSLAWQSCGEGCERADIVQGHGQFAADGKLDVSVRDGVPTVFLHLTHADIRSSAHNLMIQRIVDLRTGKTVAAVQEVMRRPSTDDGYATCGPSYILGSALAASAVLSQPEGRSPVLVHGTWSLDDRHWVWQLPWPTVDDLGFHPGGGCSFTRMETGGRMFYECGYSIRAALTPGSSEISTFVSLVTEGHFARHGNTLGDTYVWPEVRTKEVGSRVRMWTAERQEIQTIAELDHYTCVAGLSDDRVAGYSTTSGCSYTTGARLWIADRGEGGMLENLRFGPELWEVPVVTGGDLSTWGDFIAVGWNPRHYGGRPAARGRVLLARTSDWSMRVLPGFENHEAWAASLDDQYLYVLYTEAGLGNGVGRFTHVYRYDLERFDDIGHELGPIGSTR